MWPVTAPMAAPAPTPTARPQPSPWAAPWRVGPSCALDDLDLAILVAGDDRRVEIMRGLNVERLDRNEVILGLSDKGDPRITLLLARC